MDKKIVKNTIIALKKNNINAVYIDRKEEVLEKVKELLTNGSTVASGGSETLKECGIIELLRSGEYNFLDREKTDDIEKLYRETFNADYYFCGCNAVTENGELYNVDGNSNRVAAICYGPAKVIMVVGINKIVKNIDEAIKRVKTVAAPKNAKRLFCDTFCNKTGVCMGVDGDMCSGCNSNARICCNYVVSAKQRHKNRINIIFVGEELGY